MEFRPYYFAREWIKDEHNVTIVGASFSHVRSNQPDVKSSFSKEIIDGISYLWLKTPAYRGNGIKRFLNMIVFILRLFINKKRIIKESNPDVVIASSTYPLDVFPAKAIAKKTKAKLIFEVHDLWPLSPMILGGMPKYHPFILIMQLGEDFACKWADKIVSILPLAKEHFVERGMNPEKFVHIPNGIVIEEWKEEGDLPDLHKREIDKLKNDGKFLVCYAGAHGLANSLESFVLSAKKVEEKNVHYLLVGDGPLKKNLCDLAKENNIKNISFLPPVPKSLIPSLLTKMDVLFFSLQKCSLFKYGISPNKLIDYMMSGKPIINAVESGNDIVKECGCGITVEPENIEEYVNAIERLLKMTEEERKCMGEKGREYVLKNNNYKKLAKLFINEIERVNTVAEQ